MADHWGLPLRDWREFIFGKKKRRSRFVKTSWQLPLFDRYGRPPKHPLFEKPKIQN
jgi:hypothetical protein